MAAATSILIAMFRRCATINIDRATPLYSHDGGAECAALAIAFAIWWNWMGTRRDGCEPQRPGRKLARSSIHPMLRSGGFLLPGANSAIFLCLVAPENS
jgi:hypothetical protein